MAYANVQSNFSAADLTNQLYINLQKEQIFHFYLHSYSFLTSFFFFFIWRQIWSANFDEVYSINETS